jgi:DNA-binding XRE family transcriptional regulator
MARRGMTQSACRRAFAVGIQRALSRQMAPRYSTTEDEDWCAWLRKLGESMRELRESLGLSQEELASRAGLSQGSVSRFENGRNSHIGALVILKLGAALARQCHGPREHLLLDAMKGVLNEFGRLSGPALTAATLVDGTASANGGSAPRLASPLGDGRNLFLREGETWTIGRQGAVRPLRDNKGMRYIAYLLRNPGRDVPAIQLLEGSDDVSPAAPHPTVTERARLSVTRAIRRALFRIAAVQPVLGRHLHTTIRTGTRCSYTPGQPPIDWEVAETD